MIRSFDVHVLTSISSKLEIEFNKLVEEISNDGWTVKQVNFYNGTEYSPTKGHCTIIGYNIIAEKKEYKDRV